MALTAAVGMFDGVHLGHQALVRDVCHIAHSRHQLPAIFTFDRNPLEIVAPERAPSLLSTVEERCQLLRKAGAAEAHVLTFDHEMRSLTAHDFLKLLRKEYDVRTLVLGFNHRFGSDRVSDFEKCRQIGEAIGMEVLKASEFVVETISEHGITEAIAVSSTAIRNALTHDQLSQANLMLGRHYSVSGTVQHGQSIGHTLGFPTANLKPLSPKLLIPAQGVYASLLKSPKGTFPAMTNIGCRPTIDGGDKQPTIEAHAIGFDGDLYGVQVQLAFVEKLRDERRFPSLEALKEQLKSDREAVLKILRKAEDSEV